MDGKRTPVDFEKVKVDLRELGASLRSGFEEAKQGFKHGIKNTSRLKFPVASTDTPEQLRHQIQEQVETSIIKGQAMQPIPVKLKRVRGGSTRKYSLAQATLGILGGAGLSGVMFYVLNTAEASGLLSSIEARLIAQVPNLAGITGIAATAKSLWILGLLPAVKGVGHLLNAILFAAKPEPEAREIEITVPYSVKVTAVSKLVPAETEATPPSLPVIPERDTNEFYGEPATQPVSVVEEETIRFGSESKA